jgi:glycosyltransferase involved in cell wall biosynthesis
MHVLLFANCITATCRQRRNNARYDSPAGRRKVLLLSTYLVQLGHTVEIVSPSYAKLTDAEFVENLAPGLTVRHAPTLAFWGIAPARQKRVAQYNARLVHTHRGHPDTLVISYNYHREYAAALLCAARECGLKTMLEYEDGLFLIPEWQHPAGLNFERSVYAATTAFLVVNRGLEARIQQVLGKSPPCLLLPGLPDLALLKSHMARPPPGHQRLLFTGNFGREQGFGQLCSWIEHLPAALELDICGRASDEEIRDLSRLVATRPNIRFQGFLPEEKISELMRQADACLLLNNQASPFFHTQFPSKFFDYLSHNKRVISVRDERLEPFKKLSQLVQVEDFPHGLKHLPELLRTAPPPDPLEVLALGEDLRRQLGDFLAKI